MAGDRCLTSPSISKVLKLETEEFALISGIIPSRSTSGRFTLEKLYIIHQPSYIIHPPSSIIHLLGAALYIIPHTSNIIHLSVNPRGINRNIGPQPTTNPTTIIHHVPFLFRHRAQADD